jgi:phage recombination protein Bet
MSNEIVKQDKVTDAELIMHLENLGLLKDLTAGEKNSYLQIAKAFNLNPFKREIHVSKYNGQMSIITGYEVYIKRAERTGQLDGWSVATTGSVATNDLKAVITIHRKDRSHPFIWEAEYNEFVQKTREGVVTKFWQKATMMIKKVAISQGFRLCFSDELGGMPYTYDEMPDKTEDVQHEVIIKVPIEPSKISNQELESFAKNKPTPEELDQAIKNLDLCETKKDLQDLKKTTPAYIVADASFIEAGKKRYEVIMAAKS